jgi:hypothetical protein
MTSISDCLPNLPTVTSLTNSQPIVVLRVIDGELRPALASVGTVRPSSATDSVLGIIRLTGDLAGTAEAPTVPGLALKANINSPILTGTPTAPTPSSNDNSTKIATTAHVRGAIDITPLSGLADTLITSPANGQVLAWNGANWVNQMVAGTGDILSTNNLSEVSNKQVALNNLINSSNNIFTTGAIRWNTNYNTIVDLPSAATYRGMFAVAGTTPYYSTGTAWVNLNSNITTLSSLLDVNLSNLAPNLNNQVLGYDIDTSRWVARTLPPTPPVNTFTNLGALTDVNLIGFNPLLSNQVLGYDTVQNKWVARTVTTGGGGPVTLGVAGLTDVNVATLDTNLPHQVLGYDHVQDKWIPRVISPPATPPAPGPDQLSELLDVNLSTLNTGISGQVLSYNPTQNKWVPFTPPTVNVISVLSGLTDVNLTQLNSSLPGQYLSYSTVQNKWVAATLPVQTSITSTSDLPEGNNLYYTNARADARVTPIVNTLPLSALADVTNEGATAGMVLTWSGTAWGPAVIPASGGGGGGGGGGATVPLPLSSKGDLLTYSTQIDKISAGANGYFLMSDSGTPTGLVWSQPTLNQLSDVDTGAANDNEVLTKIGNGWIPRPVVSNLNSLSDVDIITPTNGQTIIYDQGGWVNARYSISNLAEVNINAPELNDRSILGWSTSASKWELKNIPTTTSHITEGNNLYYTDARVSTQVGTLSIDALADVSITSPQPNQYLVRNAQGQWANQNTPFSQFISKGDLLVFTGTDFVRLPLGNNGQALTVETTAPAGLAWRAAGVNPSLNSLSDTDITFPLNDWSVLAYNPASGKWVDKDFSNQVALERQIILIGQPIFLTLNSPGNQHFDPLFSSDPNTPETYIREVYLPNNPSVGTRFRILNIKQNYTINVRAQTGNSIILALGSTTATYQAEFTWDGVGWYYWG